LPVRTLKATTPHSAVDAAVECTARCHFTGEAKSHLFDYTASHLFDASTNTLGEQSSSSDCVAVASYGSRFSCDYGGLYCDDTVCVSVLDLRNDTMVHRARFCSRRLSGTLPAYARLCVVPQF
jgi:hypothetical protein